MSYTLKSDVRFLNIEVTNYCNFNCSYCCSKDLPKKHIELSVFESIISKFNNVEHISLQGEGEPLMHPDFFQIVEITKKYQPNSKISIVSNGSFIGNYVKELAQSAIDVLHISIDTANPALFREVRKGGDLNKIVHNIRLLKKKCDESLKIGIASVILKSNLKELDKLFELYTDLGLNAGIRFQSLVELDFYEKKYDSKISNERVNQNELYQCYLSLLNDKEKKNIINTSVKDFIQDLYSSGKGSKDCPWLKNALFINSFAEVTGCCGIKDFQNFGFGNIETVDLEFILEKREKLLNNLKNKNIPICCKYCTFAMN